MQIIFNGKLKFRVRLKISVVVYDFVKYIPHR